MAKIWANSGDSHLVEPDDLFDRSLPGSLAARMPRSVKDLDGGWETIHVDGQEFRRRLPRPGRKLTDENGHTVPERAPGANDRKMRLLDLDSEGIWAELIYPSLGMWTSSIRDPELLAAGARAINDWAIEYQRFSPRYVSAATIPFLTVSTAVAEVTRAASLGFHAASLPVVPLIDGDDWHRESWEPLWTALAETGLVIAFHIGSEPHEASSRNGTYYRGPGGALLNYLETTYGGQRAVAKLIAGGVFDRHPSLRAIVSEGGATWGPFVADRLDEAYRQHASAVHPRLRRLPSAYLYENVYASFQHDRSAVAAVTAMGWRNVCWGSDYPHIEGTFGHTQKTLQELVGDLDPATRHRITQGAFQELFPHVPPAPDGESSPDPLLDAAAR
ncbi:amidohydrolase family protein [Frankia sp. EAN1pec]|uniref:amidohydrolase family protein n=1 Tax=Parafrankia sp. (strain EAN1pec) TaxID=298653 RepID=UPI0000544EA3